MGAIYGIVGDANEHELAAMSERLQHRGRFSQTSRVSTRAWLGSRSNRSTHGLYQIDDLTLVADATLYDTAPLRALIAARGYRFDSDTEDELILAAYRYLGRDCFRHLHGDFSFAIWDEKLQALVLARDAAGARPLYYWSRSEELAFASEYKALLASDRIPAHPDLDAIKQLHHTKFPPPNRTLLAGIIAVPPGQFMVFERERTNTTRYWKAQLAIQQRTEAEHTRDVRERLRQAVERRVRGLDTVGVNLSSGIDSTVIVGSLRQSFPELPVHSFTGGYGPDDPEMLGAELVSNYCGTIHHPIVVDAERVHKILPSLVWHLEDPVARSETIFSFEIARVASCYTNVLLGGYASDALFGGMPKHKILKLIDVLPPFKVPLTEFLDYTQLSAVPDSLAGKALKRMYFRGADVLPPSIVGSTWQPSRSKLAYGQTEFLNECLVAGLANGYRDIPKIERPHAAFGIEIRYPFLDLDLINTAFQVPARYKIRRWREKHILREAAKGLLPKQALETPKFPARMRSDIPFSEALETHARKLLTTSAILERGLFEPREIEHLLARDADKPYPYEHAMRIWTVVMTELWAQSFLDQRGAPPRSEAIRPAPEADYVQVVSQR